MQKKEKVVEKVKAFRYKHGIEGSEENIVVAVHLMNVHGLDKDSALDQSSRSANDNGIDGWYFDLPKNKLHVYQSKLTESKALVLKGFQDLKNGSEWLEKVLVVGKLEKIPNDNPSLYNLYIALSQELSRIKYIHFHLLSLFDANEIEDEKEYEDFSSFLAKSKLNSHMVENRSGNLKLDVDEICLETSIPTKIKEYAVEKIENAQITLRNNAHLDLAYIPLYDLVELYRKRGDILFDKNVRLSLINTKEAKQRLVHPLQETLDNIVCGKLSPNIFPFYHIGVTIAAISANTEGNNVLNLQSPSVINGCQTISIANDFLKTLERMKQQEKIELFKLIKVIAKVVVGTNNEELKEITNCNNRQNPIENWQLFSNESVQIELEDSLKEWGIFYQRQKGKFDAIMKIPAIAQQYHSTNGTFIQVMELGQILALNKNNPQWAAKPSEIFLNKDNHDKIFSREIKNYPKDIIVNYNLLKAAKRGLAKYLDKPSHSNDFTQRIFSKPIVKQNVYYIVNTYFYQNKFDSLTNYHQKLSKIASANLVSEIESFLSKIVTKIKTWYLEESKNLETEVAKKRMDLFFASLGMEVGIDLETGYLPFCKNSLNNSFIALDK